MATRCVRVAALLAAFVLAGCKAAPGAACADEGSAQCDGSRMLVCQSHRWQAVSCAGPAGCSTAGRMIDCDETRANVGEPCGADPVGYAGCSADGKSRLKCSGGSWQTDVPCRGPKGCVVTGRFVDCDDAVAELGDACDPDALACSVDGKSVLVCRGGKHTLDEACAPGKCFVRGDTVGCE